MTKHGCTFLIVLCNIHNTNDKNNGCSFLIVLCNIHNPNDKAWLNIPNSFM